MAESFSIIQGSFLKNWLAQIDTRQLEKQCKTLIIKEITTEDFEYYFINSSLFSSKIEGNTLDFNSFFRFRGVKDFPKKKESEEIENLVSAYRQAFENGLSESKFLECHKIVSQTLLPAKERGVYRNDQVGIRDAETGRPVYLAVEPEFVKEEMQKLFSDIKKLVQEEMQTAEVFYYASMLHLQLAMIHPFADGNGRMARLLEKWFLAEKLGKAAWAITSEKYYWDNRPDYYKNIALGFNYYALRWERCIPFLNMLTEALNKSDQASASNTSNDLIS